MVVSVMCKHLVFLEYYIHQVELLLGVLTEWAKRSTRDMLRIQQSAKERTSKQADRRGGSQAQQLSLLFHDNRTRKYCAKQAQYGVARSHKTRAVTPRTYIFHIGVNAIALSFDGDVKLRLIIPMFLGN